MRLRNDTGSVQILYDNNGESVTIAKGGIIRKSKFRFIPVGFVPVDDVELIVPISRLAGKVSVIVLTLGNLGATKRCLSCVKTSMEGFEYEIVVVDNHSSDDTARWVLMNYPEATFLRNSKNLGIPAGRNQGASVASGKYLLFLDNDQFLSRGSVHALANKLKDGNDIVGSEHFTMNEDGTPNRVDSELFCYNDYVGAGGMMLERSVFLKMAGFDLSFSPAYYEDSDLCFRARKAGLKIGAVSNAAISHEGHRTLGDKSLVSFDSSKVLEASKRRFLDRWSGWIKKEFIPVAPGLPPRKVLMVYDQPNWAFHSQVKGMKKYCSLDVELDLCSCSGLPTVDLSRYDVAFCMCLLLSIHENLYRVMRTKPFVSLVHHCPTKEGLDYKDSADFFIELELANAKSAMRCASISRVIQHLWMEKKGLDTWYLPAGTDCTLFAPQAGMETRRAKGRGDRFVLGFCGDTNKRLKGFKDILLPAVGLVKEAGYDVTLKVKGASDLIPHEEMPKFYEDVDIYVCASSAEGLPTPLMEACSCAIPFVSTDVGAVREVDLQHQNVIVDRSPGSLANGIISMIDSGDLIGRGSVNRQVIKDGWDWTWIADVWGSFAIGDEELYKRLMAERDERLCQLKRE